MLTCFHCIPRSLCIRSRKRSFACALPKCLLICRFRCRYRHITRMSSMEEKHKDRLRVNRIFLLENLTDVNGVLNYLWHKDIFTKPMIGRIKVGNIQQDHLQNLLDMLPKRGPRAFDTFIQALRSCEEHECAKRLEMENPPVQPQNAQPGGIPAYKRGMTSMLKIHKDRLKEERIFLMENLTDVAKSGVLHCLLQSKIFTKNMVARIEAEKTEEERTRELLDSLPKRGPFAFDSFIQALRQCEENHCADQLENLLTPIEEQLPKTWPDGYSPNTVSLILCRERPEKELAMKDIIRESKAYPMQSYHRGACIIINNHDFSDAKSPTMENRDGTDTDCDGLHAVFKSMGFEVEIQRNLSAKGMRAFLKDVAEGKKRLTAEMDCLVVFVLSHGGKGVVYGVDGESVKVKELQEQFNGKNCTMMKEKPKLIFLQACQKADVPSPKDAAEELSQDLEGLKISDAQEEDDGENYAHMLVGRATHPGLEAWRSNHFGSWYIQALIHVLKMYSHYKDIYSMLSLVHQLVRKVEKNQTPVFRSSLDKDLYFFPGLNPPKV